MGFNPTFYAGRPKLSEVTIDSDLDMGGRNILRVGRIDTPYMPETWPTEELDWGDVPAGEPISFGIESAMYLPAEWTTLKTFEAPPGDSYTWRFKILTGTSSSSATFRITADGVEIYTGAGPTTLEGTLTVDVVVPAGSTVVVEGRNNGGTAYLVLPGSNVQNLGIVGGPKTFDLTGKWLALGLDMQGLAATVKIQGVEMPYSDYVKYFPLAPTELKIPGGWDASQIRPVLEVYV